MCYFLSKTDEESLNVSNRQHHNQKKTLNPELAALRAWKKEHKSSKS